MLSKEKKEKLESNIWKWYLVTFISALWFSAAIFVLFYQHFGLTFLQISITEIVIAFFIFILEVPSGAFADLAGRKWSVFLGLFGIGIAMAVFAISSTFPWFLFGSLMIAIGSSFISGADTALLYDTLKCLGREKEFLKIRGKMVLVFYSAVTTATVIGGYLFSLNIRYPYYLNIASFLTGSLIVLAMQEPYVSKKRYSFKRQWKQMRQGFNQLVRHERLLWLTMIAITLNVFTSFVHNILAQPYIISLGISEKYIGVVFGCIFLLTGLMLCRAEKMEAWLGEKGSFYLLVLGNFIVFMLMAMTSIKLAVLLVLFMYMFWEFADIILQKYMHEHIRSSHRATVISIQSMFRGLAVIILFTALGKLTDAVSMAATFVVSGFLVLAIGIALLYVRYKRSIWRNLD